MRTNRTRREVWSRVPVHVCTTAARGCKPRRREMCVDGGVHGPAELAEVRGKERPAILVDPLDVRSHDGPRDGRVWVAVTLGSKLHGVNRGLPLSPFTVFFGTLKGTYVWPPSGYLDTDLRCCSAGDRIRSGRAGCRPRVAR